MTKPEYSVAAPTTQDMKIRELRGAALTLIDAIPQAVERQDYLAAGDSARFAGYLLFQAAEDLGLSGAICDHCDGFYSARDMDVPG